MCRRCSQICGISQPYGQLTFDVRLLIDHHFPVCEAQKLRTAAPRSVNRAWYGPGFFWVRTFLELELGLAEHGILVRLLER